MKKLIFLTLVIITFFNCNSTEEQKVSYNNEFSLTIPASLTKTSNLNDVAELQYQDIWQELYVIVIQESKTELDSVFRLNDMSEYVSMDVDGYHGLITSNFKEVIKDCNFSESKDTVINNMKSKIQSLEGSVDNLNAYYNLGIFESEHNFYQVLTWTLADSKNKHQAAMNTMMYSFTEAQKKKKGIKN